MVKTNQKENISVVLNKYVAEPTEQNLLAVCNRFDPIIHSIAKKFQSSPMLNGNYEGRSYFNGDYEDLIQEGYHALIWAIKHGCYNSKIASPSTYFYACIYGAMVSYFNGASNQFNMNDYTAKKVSQVKKFFDNGGENPEEYGLSEKDLVKFNKTWCVSLDAPVQDEDGEEVSLHQTIADTTHESIERTQDVGQLYRELKRLLNEMDYKILLKKYIEGYEINEIAKLYDIPESDIQESLKNSLELLNKKLDRDIFSR